MGKAEGRCGERRIAVVGMRCCASGVARLKAVPALYAYSRFLVHLFTFCRRLTPDARERIPIVLPCESFFESFLGDQESLATLQALASVAQEVSAPQEFFSAGLVKDNV